MATTTDDVGGGSETAKMSTTERAIKSEYFHERRSVAETIDAMS